MGFSTKSWAEHRAETAKAKETAYHNKKEAEHAQAIKAGYKPHKDAGYSKPGYNQALGKYINNKSEWRSEYKKMKAENPNIESM